MFIILLCGAFVKISAQNFTVSFRSSNSGNSIDSVWVYNQTTNQKVKLLNNESLVLSVTTDLRFMLLGENRLIYYPNPCSGEIQILFSVNESSQAILTVFDILGNKLALFKEFISSGNHHFKVAFPFSGIFIVRIENIGNPVSFKVTNLGTNQNICNVEYLGNENLSTKKNANIGYEVAEKILKYSQGDVLIYEAHSGKNTTIISDSPTLTKTYQIDFQPCIDAHNRSYKIVKIGTQMWMAENLAYLPSVSPPYESSNSGKYYYVYNYYGSNTTEAKTKGNYITYGVLYNWPSAMNGESSSSSNPSGVQGICPPGWHLPSIPEWGTLITHLGGEDNAGGKLKSKTGWNAPNVGAVNEKGFSALPGGTIFEDTFWDEFYLGEFWSASVNDNLYPLNYYLSYNNSSLQRGSKTRNTGLSVRCISNAALDSEPEVFFSVSTENLKVGEVVNFTDNSLYTPNKWSWDFGDGTTSSLKNPSHTFTKSGSYLVTLTTSNNRGSSSKSILLYVVGPISDVDGNIYNVEKIGNQIWMKENLKVKHYNNGDQILTTEIGKNISSETAPKYYWNENTIDVSGFTAIADILKTLINAGAGGLTLKQAQSNGFLSANLVFQIAYGLGISESSPMTINEIHESYSKIANGPKIAGAYYTYYAIKDNRKICPDGWHVPSLSEWEILTNFLKGPSVAGGKMKETGTLNWKNPNTGATNESKFSGLPAGLRSSIGIYGSGGFYGCWWSDYDFPDPNKAISIVLSYESLMLFTNSFEKSYGLNVRCMKN